MSAPTGSSLPLVVQMTAAASVPIGGITRSYKIGDTIVDYDLLRRLAESGNGVNLLFPGAYNDMPIVVGNALGYTVTAWFTPGP